MPKSREFATRRSLRVRLMPGRTYVACVVSFMEPTDPVIGDLHRVLRILFRLYLNERGNCSLQYVGDVTALVIRADDPSQDPIQSEHVGKYFQVQAGKSNSAGRNSLTIHSAFDANGFTVSGLTGAAKNELVPISWFKGKGDMSQQTWRRRLDELAFTLPGLMVRDGKRGDRRCDLRTLWALVEHDPQFLPIRQAVEGVLGGMFKNDV